MTRRPAAVPSASRIGMVTPRYPPDIGGVETHVERLALGLGELGWRVEVITTDPEHRSPALAARDGLPVLRFPTIADDATFYLAPRLGWWLLRHARRYDVIHAHSYHTPVALLAGLAARLAARPLVLTPHYHGTGHTSVRRWLHGPYRLPGRWLVRGAALVICSSEAERALVQRDFGADVPTRVIPHGIEVAGYVSAAPFRDLPGTTILTGGRLEAYKQVDRVIAAMAALPADHHLYVFGDGPAAPALHRLAETSPARPRIRFLGRVPQPDLERWARSADVFVSLSREEAFGLTVVETAAAGAAQVISDIPAFLEMRDRLAGHPVEVVRVDADPTAVAAAIQAVTARRSDGPRPTLALPTWEAMADRTAAAYRAVLAAGSVPEPAR